MIDDILTSTGTKKPSPASSEPRKDLVNKNILRIISRFFKAKLKAFYPNFAE
eukprot:CAMPEP_0168333472 /NCGR_PEP_ID=MMETSP0213-20121227/9628_1 /TAXON_ID=151035 /ORGANISM="Euplotes harpa, Strain FSP1.4" /LENGTH=51 /DNA_ID=CAMNT_0008337803 /DNA_START=691 /DNA_END=846 /DNA_ORIENTATION=-